MKILSLCLSLIFGFLFAYGQISALNSPYYQDGSYNVAFESVFTSPNLYTYRPQQGSGPFPVFIFQPGANPLFGSSFIDYSSYDIYLEHLASYGYIVIVIDDASAGFPNGNDFNTAYNWYLQKLNDPNHWMGQIADTNSVVVGGHSLGGVKASDFLQNNKSNIQGIVYFASFPSQGLAGIAAHNIDDYEGKVLTIAGQEDVQSTPNECYEGYESYEQAECRYWVLLDGVGHGGFGDYNNPDQPVGSIGRQEVTASIRHYFISFMEYAFKGDEIAGDQLNKFSLQIDNTLEFETNCLYISGTDEFCLGDTAEYEIAYDSGNPYCWQVNQGSIISNNGTAVQVVWDTSGTSTINITECNRIEYNGSKQIRVEALPDADISYTSNDGLFQFQSAGVANANYNWDFGDSSFASLPNPVHQYSDTGQFIVGLVATTNLCVTSNKDTVISDLCPEAAFSYSVVNGQIDLDNQSGFYNRLFWDFGNGDTSALLNPQPILEEDSTYQVQLIAYNNFCSDTFSQSVNIGQCPEANFDFTQNGLSVSFNNLSSDNQLNIWSIDNESISFDRNLNYTFPDTGTYTVSLTVYNINNCEDSFSRVIEVFEELDIEDPNDSIINSLQFNRHENWKVYPNPVKDELFIEMPESNVENLKMKIFSMKGKLIYDGLVKNRIELSFLPVGIYNLVLYSEKDLYFLKLVKS